MSSCCACNSQDSVSYKCPGCSRKYCSVACCKEHKSTFGCDGKRKRFPYVPLGAFDQKQFLDDYFFLEEVNQKIDNAIRLKPSLNLLKNKHKAKKRKQRNRNTTSGPSPASAPVQAPASARAPEPASAQAPEPQATQP